MILRDPIHGLVAFEGEREQVHCFARRLDEERPAAAMVLAREISRLAPAGYRGFEIRSSDAARPKAAGVLPDLATCAECRNELFDPMNRRFLYPFINCTKCGPRYTIIDDIPYDRSASAMRLRRSFLPRPTTRPSASGRASSGGT